MQQLKGVDINRLEQTSDSDDVITGLHAKLADMSKENKKLRQLLYNDAQVDGSGGGGGAMMTPNKLQ